jgi:hypothetical protein
MSKHFYWILLMGMMAASCGSAEKDKQGALNDKKAELEKLKKEQKKLADKVAVLEAEIAKADPGGAASVAKLVTVMPLTTQAFSHYIDLQGKVDAQNIS